MNRAKVVHGQEGAWHWICFPRLGDNHIPRRFEMENIRRVSSGGASND